MSKKSVFQTLSAVDVSDKVEKKGNLSYLSWAWAWGEVKKRYPSAEYWYYQDDETNLPMAFNNGFGGFCYTSVTIEGNTLPMWLPVLDHRNQSVLKPNAFQVNTTLMRCLTKNLAMHGLGHYIYVGEDFPAKEEKPNLSKSDLAAVLKGTKENARTVLSSYSMSNEYKEQIINKFKS
jgi:hypothetical protein